MTITGQSSLSKDSIDQMVKDAEAHAEEDRRRREEAEVRNTADTLVYQTEKLLKEQGDKITGDEKDAVEAKLAELKTALEGTDLEPIKGATEALMTASQTFAQRLYDAAAQDATGGAGAGPDAASGADDDEVVEAEIVDEGDEGDESQSA
jgi:molecular chaperone DnaK